MLSLLVKYSRLLGLIALRRTTFSLAFVCILWRPFFPRAFSQFAWAVAYVFAIHFSESFCPFDSIRKADKAIPYRAVQPAFCNGFIINVCMLTKSFY